VIASATFNAFLFCGLLLAAAVYAGPAESPRPQPRPETGEPMRFCGMLGYERNFWCPEKDD
jgi:hypothetical protein